MGLIDRFEGKLERAYNGIFARAFRAEVQPVEIASAIRGAMDDRAASAGRGRALVPNVFTIELSETDHDRLVALGDRVADELIVAADEHASAQRYTPGGPITINLVEATDLETGIFRVRPSTARHVGPSSPSAAPAEPAWVRPEDSEDDEYDEYDEYEDDDWEDDGGYAVPSRPAADLPVVAPPRHPVTPAPAVAPPAPPQRKVKASDRPCLIHDGHRYLLIGAINVLGRDDSADVILDDPGVSRRHSEIRVSIDGPHFVAVIRDLGSTNGTFVNGERVDSEHLHDGDQVTVGRTSLTYRANRP
ncbi:MAG: DUF3662 and FHA domain-containing protein [Actinobacteria bacterium]|nr:DUF3662 and FHA domain-containing protein [Actinomycetota bacterium]